MISYFVTRLRHIPVTPKSEKPLSPADVLNISSYSLGFQGVLWIGVIGFNPLGAVFNAMWLIPMFLAPFILMMYSGYRRQSTGTIRTTGLRVSAANSDPGSVHALLSTVISTEAGPSVFVGEAHGRLHEKSEVFSA